MRIPLGFLTKLSANLDVINGAYSLYPVRQQFTQMRAAISKVWAIEHTERGRHNFPQSTWTPIIGGSTATSGQTYNAQTTGRYMNLGGLVVAQFLAHLSAAGTVTGDAQLQNLPVASADIADPGIVYIPYWANFIVNASTTVGGLVNRNTTTATLYDDIGGGSGTSAIMSSANIGDTTLIQGIAVYFAAPLG